MIMALHQQYPWITRVYFLWFCLFTITGWGEIGRSQTLPNNIEFNKTAKPCFPQRATLPPPPLSQTELSVPSLWLAEKRYGGETLNQWFIGEDSTPILPNVYLDRFVTLVVNRFQWNQKRYLEQFIFIHNFAEFTRSYGYNLRVCNDNGNLVGYYICDFQVSPLNCQIHLESRGWRVQDFRVFTD